MNAQRSELPITNEQSMMIKSILLKKMMIKARLSTIIENSWTIIYNHEILLHFCVNIFYSKMFVKWSRFYVITYFSTLMLSRSLIAQLAFFWCFQLKHSRFKFLLSYYNYQINRKKKKCIQCLELIYAMAGLTIDALTREKMDLAAKDLEEEISTAKSSLD